MKAAKTVLALALALALAGCNNLALRELYVVTYVTGDDCYATRSSDAELNAQGSGSGQVGADAVTQSGDASGTGQGAAALARLLASKVGCEPTPDGPRE